MTFCARYRFKLCSPLQVEQGVSISVTLPGLPAATFERADEASSLGHWIIAKIDGFATEDEALKVGQWLGDTLLVTGAIVKLGIDIGFSQSTLQFSREIHASVRETTGRELRAETHGLMIYEQDTIGIVGMQAHGSVLVGLPMLKEQLRRWVEPSRGLTDRQRNCAALINDSFFVGRTEGRFILLISAVEALCDQRMHEPRYQAAIEELELHLAAQTLDHDVRETTQRLLANAKRQSLRQAYMSKFNALLSATEAKAFDDLYRLRSKLVHDGIGRGTLNEAANTALQLATDLLEAELRQTNVA